MNNLIKHELFKLVRSRTFVVVVVISLIVAIMCAAVSIFVNTASDLQDDVGDIMSLGIMGYGINTVATFATMSNIWNILIAIVVGKVVCAEHNTGLTRNIVMTGYDRAKIYLSKCIIVAGLFVVIFVIVCILQAIVPIATIGFGDGNASIASFVASIFKVLLVIMGMVSFTVFVGFVARRTITTVGVTYGTSVAFATLYSLVIILTSDMENIDISSVLNPHIAATIVNNLYVGNALMTAAKLSPSIAEVVLSIIVPIVTIAITLPLGIHLFNRRELK